MRPMGLNGHLDTTQRETETSSVAHAVGESPWQRGHEINKFRKTVFGYNYCALWLSDV